MKDAALRFALRAAGAGEDGVAFGRFRGWLSPWGWTRDALSVALRSLRDDGVAHIDEGADGEILFVRLTPRGERELAGTRKETRGLTPPR